MVVRVAPEAVARQNSEDQHMSDYEDFLPGTQNPPPTEDDGVAPSSLDQSRDSDPTASTGYGGGVY